MAFEGSTEIHVNTQSVKEVLDEVIPKKQLQLKQLVSPLQVFMIRRVPTEKPQQKTEHGQAVLGDVKVCHCRRVLVQFSNVRFLSRSSMSLVA